MKNQIWSWILIFCSILMFFPSCCEHDDDEPVNCSEEGNIVGIDFRKCFCCGGWFIEIDGDTLRAPNLPQEFTQHIDFNEFPLPVYLEWALDETLCLGDEIEVECIRRQE